jgi:energy-coupling factor transporter ATP-binding protein EcfA2
VAGLDVRDDTLGELRARVGLVFQDPDDQLFMPSVAADVAFGPRNLGLDEPEIERRTRAALAAVRMSHVAGRAPHQLSMGERRRVAIAGVLAMDPRLLVFDEPSANLDPRARRELLELLAALDRTLLVVTHDLPFAVELCERAVILSGGRIAADGPCADVLADADLLARHDLELPAGFDPQLVERRVALTAA